MTRRPPGSHPSAHSIPGLFISRTYPEPRTPGPAPLTPLPLASYLYRLCVALGFLHRRPGAPERSSPWLEGIHPALGLRWRVRVLSPPRGEQVRKGVMRRRALKFKWSTAEHNAGATDQRCLEGQRLRGHTVQRNELKTQWSPVSVGGFTATATATDRSPGAGDCPSEGRTRDRGGR